MAHKTERNIDKGGGGGMKWGESKENKSLMASGHGIRILRRDLSPGIMQSLTWKVDFLFLALRVEQRSI